MALTAPGFERVRCVLVPPLPEAERPEDLPWLGEAERAFAAALERPQRRADWLAGRLAAKLAISQVLEEAIELAQLSVASAPGGRPLATRGRACLPIHLTISHSRGVGLAAASSGPRPIGIDLEHRTGWIEELRDYALGSAERARLPAAAGEQEVLAHWTLKEAALKALGLGLRLHPRRVEVEGVCADPAGAARWSLSTPGAEAGSGWFAHAGPFTWALAESGTRAA
jgi:4'-phosphopantetheinyl transferase